MPFRDYFPPLRYGKSLLGVLGPFFPEKLPFYCWGKATFLRPLAKTEHLNAARGAAFLKALAHWVGMGFHSYTSI